MVLEDRGVTTYPEYADVKVMCKDWGLVEAVSDIEGCLGEDWWCPVRRTLPYSHGSASSVDEVFMLVKKPYGGENFKADSGGKLLYVGKGNRREMVYPGHHDKSKAMRRLVILETAATKAFYLRHNGESYRGFRYYIQLNFQNETKNKAAVHEFLQDYLEEAHPAIFPSYFKMLVDRIKIGAIEKQDLHTYLLRNFKKSILAFRHLIKIEAQAAARQHSESTAMKSITVRRADLPPDSPPPHEEDLGVALHPIPTTHASRSVTPPLMARQSSNSPSTPDLDSILCSVTPPRDHQQDYSHTSEQHPSWVSFAPSTVK